MVFVFNLAKSQNNRKVEIYLDPNKVIYQWRQMEQTANKPSAKNKKSQKVSPNGIQQEKMRRF
jgi:hypothetical protein